MKTRSNDYWDKRSMQRMTEYHRGADATVQTVTNAYDKAQKDIEASVQKIFDRFAIDGNLTPDEALKMLNEPISKAEWNSIKSKIRDIQDPAIKRQMLNRLNAPAYSARITRLEALKENTYIQSKIIADTEITATTTGYINTIDDAYYRTMFDVQQGLGVSFEFASMPTSRVESILKNPWVGANFSSRIWYNTDVLAEKLNSVITSGFESGAGVVQMTRELQDMSDMGKYAANRLVRTETTYMANAAEMESYEEAEIDEYVFVATLDKRTSKKCQSLDLKVFAVKDAKPGVNMPPMHPFCRSTTIAHFGPDTLANIQRRARDPITGKNELIPAGTNYEQWRKGLDEKHGEDKIDSIQKQTQNGASDKKQFDQFKGVLGKDAPKSFAAFQDLKYNNTEDWDLVKLDKSRRNRLLTHPESKLPNAKSASAADSKFTGYLFNPDNPIGSAKGSAFSKRLGYNADNWDQLQGEIVKRSNLYPSTKKLTDQHGSRYEQKMILYGETGKPTNVVVGWNVTENETKMTTAYIKEAKRSGGN